MSSRMRGCSLAGLRSIWVVLVLSCSQCREGRLDGEASDTPNGSQATEDHGGERARPSDETTEGAGVQAEPCGPTGNAFPKDAPAGQEKRTVTYQELRKLSRAEQLRRAKAWAAEIGDQPRRAVRPSGPIDMGKTQQEIEEEARRALERIERDSGKLGELSREEVFRRAKARAAEIRDEARRAARPTGPVNMGKSEEEVEVEARRALEVPGDSH